MDVAAWKARSKRTVELPSGASVVIRLPSVPALLRAGRIPNHLLSMAQEYATAGVDPTKFDEKGHDEWEAFCDLVVAETVVEPSIAAEDVAELPLDDVQTLRAYAFRLAPIPRPVGEEVDEPETVGELVPFRDGASG